MGDQILQQAFVLSIARGTTPTDYDFQGWMMQKPLKRRSGIENPACIADLCTGRGLTTVAAYMLGKKFVGTELNKRRLAVAIERVNNLGGKYARSVS